MTQILGIELVGASENGLDQLEKSLVSDKKITVFMIDGRTVLAPATTHAVDTITKFAEQLGFDGTTIKFTGVNNETQEFDEAFARPYNEEMESDNVDVDSQNLSIRDIEDMVDVVENYESQPNVEAEIASETSMTDDDVDFNGAFGDDSSSEEKSDETATEENTDETDDTAVTSETVEEQPAIPEVEAVDVQPQTTGEEYLTLEAETTPYEVQAIERLRNHADQLASFDVPTETDGLDEVVSDIFSLSTEVDRSLNDLIKNIAEKLENKETALNNEMEAENVSPARNAHEEKLNEIKSRRQPRITRALELQTQEHANAREAYVQAHIDELRQRFDQENAQAFEDKKQQAIDKVDNEVEQAIEVENKAFDDYIETTVTPYVKEQVAVVPIDDEIQAYNHVVETAQETLSRRLSEVQAEHAQNVANADTRVDELQNEIETLRHKYSLLESSVDLSVQNASETVKAELLEKYNNAESKVKDLQDELRAERNKSAVLTSNVNALQSQLSGQVMATYPTVAVPPVPEQGVAKKV